MLLDARKLLAASVTCLAVLGLAGCGGDDDGIVHVYGPSNPANPTVARLISSVDAVGVGGAGLLSSSAASNDLQLRANLAGGTVQLRFSCSGCNLTVTSGNVTVGANQYIPIAFATLGSAADAPVTVTDNVSGAKANYVLRARPLDAAPYTIGTNTGAEAGDLYLTPFDPDGYGLSFAYQIASDGSLTYYYRGSPGRDILDFKKTVIPGGATRYSFYDEAAGGIRVMDASYTTLTVVQALPSSDGNTYAVDGHDHMIVDDGHYLIGLRASKTVANIPSLVGQQLFVGGTGLQEIIGGAAVFNWLSTDHPELYACSARGNGYAANNGADYMHWDSLVVDGDGNWVASFRHLDSVLKINRTDGAIAWVLGGTCDQFGLSAAQKFSSPHDARRAPDGRLTLFDVGAAGVASRVPAFGLDEAGKTVTGFTAYTTDAHSSYNLGSAQLFASGKLLVGWGEFNGAATDVSEYDTASGALSFQLVLNPSCCTNGYFSYRARKFP